MPSPATRSCRLTGCGYEAVNVTGADALCLDHFLEQTFVRASHALEQCQKGQPLDPRALDWLLADARHAAQMLIGEPGLSSPAQLDKLLELLLCLSNLQEYVRHHSVRLAPQ